MNTKPFLVSLSLACGWASSAHAQSTAFTYQGRLALSGSAANGLYDLRVTVYDALANGNALAGPLTNTAVSVTSGLFTATLDFGAAAFPGANRWLDIGVRTNGSVAAFTALVPRQPITAAPYGIQAASAANAASFSGTLPVANGGSGQSSYAPGDMLYASAANTLARLAVGSTGQVLAVSGSAPAWKPANAHDHIGQAWSEAVATDALYVGNSSAADGASALTGVASAAASLNYGVFGQTSSTNGTGMQGLAIAGTGSTVGVAGESDSTDGIGVYGFGGALSVAPIGVYGETSAPNGYGFYTPNRLYIGDAAYFAGNLTLLTGTKLLADSGTTNAPGIAFSSTAQVGSTPPTGTSRKTLPRWTPGKSWPKWPRCRSPVGTIRQIPFHGIWVRWRRISGLLLASAPTTRALPPWTPREWHWRPSRAWPKSSWRGKQKWLRSKFAMQHWRSAWKPWRN